MENTQPAHTLSYQHLFFVLIGLICLTGVTILASQFDFGRLNILIALTIASSKASLVLYFFMHMKYEGRLIKYSFLSTIITLAIFIGLMLWDVLYRY